MGNSVHILSYYSTLRLTTSRQRERLTSLSSHSRRQKEEHGLGIILVGMSALFIVCQSIKMIPGKYRAGRPICPKVLKILFWEVPAADWLILLLPTAQSGPRNSHGKT